MDAISRRLLFRIGPLGFCLSLDSLIEISEQDVLVAPGDGSKRESPQAGTMLFRLEEIPVVDLRGRLNLPATATDRRLILKSAAGKWALLVSEVDAFCRAADMLDRPVSYLLKAEGWRCFDEIALFQGRPYLCLNLDVCYAGGEGES